MYNKTTTNICDVSNIFNNLMPTMKFTIEEEINNKINFLDIIILKEAENLSFDIHRKATTTDTIIPNDSCHPEEHKHGARRYLANRMITYNLNAINKGKENSTIIQILYNKNMTPQS